MKLHVSLSRADDIFGEYEGMQWAVKVNTLPNGYYKMPFGRKADYRRELQAFKDSAKRGYADAKGKKGMPAVKKFIKLYDAKEFYASWKETSMYKSDSIEVFYKN